MAIPKFNQLNIGSVIRIEYVFDYQVQSVTTIDDSTMYDTGVVLQPGVTWSGIYCSPNTMGHQEDNSIDNNGEKWTQQVVGFVPGNDLAVDRGIRLLKNNVRVLLRITMPNGTRKLVGLPGTPLTCSIKSGTGTDYAGRPGTALSFTGATLDRAFYTLA